MSIESELQTALGEAGYSVADVRSVPGSRDGIERRGAIRETVDLVRNLLVFSNDELDPDTARALLGWTFSWLSTRRRRGHPDDVEYVSIYGPDGKSVLSNVSVPR